MSTQTLQRLSAPTEQVAAVVLLEMYRSASAEMVSRVTTQIRLVELYGLMMTGVYSAVIVYGRFEFLFVVGPAAGLAALWWTDRQGIIVLLRTYLAEELEPRLSSLCASTGSDASIRGWYSHFGFSNYFKISGAAHLRLMVAMFFLTVMPASLFCLACAFPSIAVALDGSTIHSTIQLVGGEPGLRFISAWSQMFTFALFAEALRVRRSHRRMRRIAP